MDLPSGSVSLDTGSSSAKIDKSTGSISENGSASQPSGTEITPEQEYFLYELETSDSGSIGLVLRAIYDGGDVHKFVRALERKIRHYDKDIERLCNFHYQGFIEAIHELLEVKGQCNSLKGDVEEIDTELHACSSNLLAKAGDIVRHRKMQKNISSAIDHVALCLPMLEKYCKLQEHMQQKKYYPALKTLEQLEHTYFPRLGRYRFVKQLVDQVTTIREQIKEASMSEFKDFLETIRKFSQRVGEVALRHTAQRHSLDPTLLRSHAKTRGAANLPAGMAPPSATSEDDEFAAAQDIIDFSPVYRCCHIFSVLDAKEEFESYYRKQRREQATLVLRTPERMRDAFDSYLLYFYEVVGFFVAETTVMKTALNLTLVTRDHRDQLWEMALQHVTKTLNSHFGNCTDADVMLQIKKLILLFALSMKDYNFHVQAFYKLLMNFRDQYNEILMAACCSSFKTILATDNCTPVTVADETAYRAVLERFPIYSRSLEQAPFPRKFPFSEFVPNIYEQMKGYIKGCYRFTEKLGMSQTEVDDTIRRYTNVLLERLSGCLKKYIESVGSGGSVLVQMVQITINMGYLERSCDSLEQYTSKLVGINQSSAHAVKLKQGAHTFTDARSEVEHQIYQALNGKISEFLELANYDWELQESTGRASSYILDMISFLNSTFRSFTNLPESLARAACLSACKHLSVAMSGMLLDPDVKCVSIGALEQFNLDLIQCEQFASQCPVPGFEEGILLLTFAELRQIMDLFLSWDWSNYLADFGHDRNKYLRVPPGTAISLLEKIMECDRRKNNTFFARGKDDKRKLLDTVLKQLRSHAAATASA